MSRPKAHRRKRTTTIITITIITTNITIITTTTTTARPKKCNLGDASDGGVFGRRQFLAFSPILPGGFECSTRQGL
jgi:hypothetical protein